MIRRFVATFSPALFVLAAFLVPTRASAQVLPACTVSGNCNGCDFIALFVGFAGLMLRFVGVAVVLMVIIGGLLWLTSAGNPERVKRGQQVIIGAVIGLAFVLGGFAIVTFSIGALTGDSQATVYGTDWASYCERIANTAGEVFTDCSEEGAEGQKCSQGTCNNGAVCACVENQCLSGCERLHPDDGICIADSSQCIDVAGFDASIDVGGGCPQTGDVCCVLTPVSP